MHFSSIPQAGFVLLFLSIYLVLQQPFHPYVASAARDPIYHKTRQLLRLLRSIEILSMDMVQSSLLITMYEYGHGYFQSPFSFVGGCARMAHALGWHRRREPCDEPVLEDEGASVERFECLGDIYSCVHHYQSPLPSFYAS